MNSKVIVGVIVAVLIVGGGWYFMSAKDGAISADMVTIGSINQLIGSGKDYECTVSQSTEQFTSTGVFYVSGGKVRGDIVTKYVAQGVPENESHMITDGKVVSFWPIVPGKGITINIDSQSPAYDAELSKDVNFNAEANYSCKPWAAKDDSKFTQPSDISFVDGPAMQQMMKEAVQNAAPVQ